MSLINDALKKAQKLQMEGQAHSTGSGQAQPPPNPGGTPGDSAPPSLPVSPGRQQSMPGQIFMLLAFGAGVLIALSVLATVYLLRQPAAPVVAQARTMPSPASPAAPAPPVVHSFSEGGSQPVASWPNPSNGPAPAENFAPAPAPALEKPPTPPTTAPTVAVTRPAPPALSLPNGPALPALPGFSEGGSLPAVSLPALNPPNGPDSSKPDPKILAYLDALQVAGVRVSNPGSKVLMNDRVFREGEIVDHLLGLRLTKIKSDLLTFVDERGVIYTKNL